MPPPTTGHRSRKKPNNSTVSASLPGPGDVLTLAEAAAYLRIGEEDVLRMVREQRLPGRLIGREWRFLKSALQDWLATPAPRSGKEALLAMAGKFKEDPFLEDIVREAYRNRGRPLGEEGE